MTIHDAAVTAATRVVVLTVDEAGLTDLVETLTDPNRGSVNINPLDTHFGLMPIRAIKLKRTDGSLVISSHGDVACIVGDQSSFVRLAEEIALMPEYNDLCEPGMHSHFDAGDKYIGISEGSFSLVIYGPVPEVPQGDAVPGLVGFAESIKIAPIMRNGPLRSSGTTRSIWIWIRQLPG